MTTRSGKNVFVAIVVASPFVLLSWWQIWIPYSYWLDELFSVTSSGSLHPDLIGVILNDVHPPLYPLLLKGWIVLFGQGETSTRILSSLFATAAVMVFAWAFRNRSLSFTIPALLFLVASPLFPFYAQETRSYAILLFLASVATAIYLNRERNPASREGRIPWYLTLLALSLTHYFGLALAGMLVIFDLIRTRGWWNRIERVLVGALMLVWPMVHVLLGSVTPKLGGNFWISSDGVQTTLHTVAEALLKAALAGVMQLPVSGVEQGLALLFAFSMIPIVWALGISTPSHRKWLVQCMLMFSSFVVLLVIIDHHTPVSTTRNYIVLLPLAGVIFGGVFQAFWERSEVAWKKSLLLVIVVVSTFLSGRMAVADLYVRWYPIQNWKGLAAEVRRMDLCKPHCWFIDAQWRGRWRFYRFYFSSEMGSTPRSVTRHISSLRDALDLRDLPLVGAHLGDEAVDFIQSQFPDMQCWQPRQSWQNSVVLFIEEIKPSHNLLPCSTR